MDEVLKNFLTDRIAELNDKIRSLEKNITTDNYDYATLNILRKVRNLKGTRDINENLIASMSEDNK